MNSNVSQKNNSREFAILEKRNLVVFLFQRLQFSQSSNESESKTYFVRIKLENELLLP